MGFNSVYRVLQEVFPQIDSRMLRAVAIEHSKDADVAVEVVLTEIIPSLSQQSHKVSSSDKNRSLLHPSEAVDSGKTGQSETMALVTGSSGQLDGTMTAESVTMESPCRSFHDANGEFGPVCDSVPIPEEKYGDGYKISPDSASSSLIGENGSYYNHDQEFVTNGGQNSVFVQEFVTNGGPDSWSVQEFVTNGGSDSGSVQEIVTNGDPDSGSVQEIVTNKGQDSGSVQELVTNGGHDSRSVQEEAVVLGDCEPLNQLPDPIGQTSNQLGANPEMQLAVTEQFDPNSFPKDALATEMDNPDDESTMNSVIMRSDQICSTEFLEDIIEDARNNKKILVSAMDSVVDLIRQVECKEKAAEQAKVEAGCGVTDIFVKVDELKQALLRAKEANDMHAGEVYAEKAILATEVKELQLRLLNLSDERDKSLEILDEMRQALEIRLATSLKEIKAGEEEKQEKQRFAKEALAYQETQMEKVVEESKRLKLEAEENSKLQDFLVDRGRAIDILQGEISVKCQDVRLLKEKFDKRIPLGRSLSSSHTSSILASSGSSLRSSTTPPEPELETFETLKKNAELGDSYGFLEKNSRPDPLIETVYSVDDHFLSGELKYGDDRKVVLDDGWELFDV